jgi:ATP-binding cassette, subfamily B (MDR/TAP), member 1
LAGLGLALRTNWKLALVVLSTIPVIAIGATVISCGLQSDIDRQNAELTAATKIAGNCITNIATVKCFTTQEEEGSAYTSAVKRAAVSTVKQSFKSSLQLGFVRFATTAMYVQGK